VFGMGTGVSPLL